MHDFRFLILGTVLLLVSILAGRFNDWLKKTGRYYAKPTDPTN
jgi:hypothetical protein